MNSTVGFCLPVFNEQRFLSQTLDSILSQTVDDFLVYISDNASTDQTPQICESISKVDSRVRYIRQPKNIGAAANFLFLLERCSTDYLCLMGAHDLIAPQYLESLLPYFQKYQSACLAYSQKSSIDVKGEVVRASIGDNIDTRGVSPAAAAWKIQKNLCGNMCYGIYRTELIKRCHLNIICRGADHVLMQELALHGPIIHHHETLYFLRDMKGVNRPKSMSYDEFCRSQLIRLDSNFFSKGSRRIHWHWLCTTLSVVLQAHTSLPVKLRSLPSVFFGFIYRWRRQLLREIFKPLKPSH